MFNFFFKSYWYVKQYIQNKYFYFYELLFHPISIHINPIIVNEKYHVSFKYRDIIFCSIYDNSYIEKIHEIRELLYISLKYNSPKKILKKCHFYKNDKKIDHFNIFHNYSWNNLDINLFDIIEYEKYDVDYICIDNKKYLKSDNLSLVFLYD